MALAKALAIIRKTPIQDQVAAAKSGWGILAENFDPAEARNLVESLRGSGLAAVALPASALAQLPEIQPLDRLPETISGRLVLIAAAGITVTSWLRVKGSSWKKHGQHLMMINGNVQSAGGSQVTIQMENGAILSLHVDSGTQVIMGDKKNISSSSIEPGQVVRARYNKETKKLAWIRIKESASKKVQ